MGPAVTDHPRGLEWICDRHLEVAQRFSHLPSAEGLKIIREQVPAKEHSAQMEEPFGQETETLPASGTSTIPTRRKPGKDRFAKRKEPFGGEAEPRPASGPSTTSPPRKARASGAPIERPGRRRHG